MKVLLVGAAGQLGQDLHRTLGAVGEVVPATRDGRAAGNGVALDLLDTAAIEAAIARVAPDVVVNAAAYTAVDRAESEPALAHAVNAAAPGAMAQACRRAGIRLVHYSTDYVFAGGARSPYGEDDAVDPQGAYGASKAAGEAAVLDSGADVLVLRTAWVYALHGQNFLRTMLRLGQERDTVRVVDDQVGCPTPAWFIAEATRELLAQPTRHPVVHVTTAGSTSWAGFASAIFREAGARGLLTRIPAVEPITTAEYPTPARRPAYSVLDTSRLRSMLATDVPAWDAALARTFERDARA